LLYRFVTSVTSMTGAAPLSVTRATRVLREDDVLARPEALHDLDALVVREPERDDAGHRLAGPVGHGHDRVPLVVLGHGLERYLHDAAALRDDDADADVHAGLQAAPPVEADAHGEGDDAARVAPGERHEEDLAGEAPAAEGVDADASAQAAPYLGDVELAEVDADRQAV